MVKLELCEVCLSLEEPVLSVASAKGQTVVKGSPIKFCKPHQKVWKKVNGNKDSVDELISNSIKGANSLLKKAIGK